MITENSFFLLFLVQKGYSSQIAWIEAVTRMSMNEQDLFPETFATISWMSLSRDILALKRKRNVKWHGKISVKYMRMKGKLKSRQV